MVKTTSTLNLAAGLAQRGQRALRGQGFDQIIVGASEEGLLEQALFGSIPQRVAEEALVSVIMVKRHDEV